MKQKRIVMIFAVLIGLVIGPLLAYAVTNTIGPLVWAWTAAGARTGYTSKTIIRPNPTANYIFPQQFLPGLSKIHLTMRNADASISVTSIGILLSSRASPTIEVNLITAANVTSELDLSTGAWTNCTSTLAPLAGCDLMLDLSMWHFTQLNIVGYATTPGATMEFDYDKQ